MVHKSDDLAEQIRQNLLRQKRENLFRTLATIHVLSKIIQVGYFDAIKDTNFRSPKIKAKADQIHKFSEDIIKSLGDAVRLKDEHADFMEYEHFTELYDLLKMIVFMDTDLVKQTLSNILELRKNG